MRKYNYVVGFEGEGKVVYGKDELDNGYKKAQFIHLMTPLQAKRQLRSLSNGKKAIYKLVKVIDIKREQFAFKIRREMMSRP